MKKITKNKLLLIILIVFFSGCQSLKDGLEGNKNSKSSEEFLIEKKNPLVLPPEFNQLPTPADTQPQVSEESINELFNLPITKGLIPKGSLAPIKVF